MATLDAFDWEAEGRRLGERLDALNAIVVLGLDPTATALVALGIARAQAPRRRVALGDLLDHAGPLETLVPHEDPHGLVDSFVYGVSLNRIGLRVPAEGELFLLPTGTEPPPYEDILPNPRWRRLAAGFREVGALLVLVAPADAPRIDALVGMLDGAVVVGDGAPRNLSLAQVISYVRQPRTRAGQPVPAVPAGAASGAAAAPAPKRRRWTTGRVVGAAAGVLLALLLVAIGLWLADRPLAGGGARPAWMTRRETTAAKPPVALAQTPPTDSAAGTVSAAPVPVNPADSDSAAAYAVALMSTNSLGSARLNLQENGRNLPAATYAPIPISGALWYRMLAGAWPDSTPADSLLAALHARGLLDQRSGAVVRTPFAFLIDSVAAGAVRAQVARYAALNLPVYPLFKSDSSARLYVGAFETPTQAATYAEALRAAGIPPVLAYRLGRVH